MMKMIQRLTVTGATAVVAVTLAAPSAMAATPGEFREGERRNPEAVNGGDNGYGNCGFNYSGGRWNAVDQLVQPNAPGPGGFKPWDACVRAGSLPIVFSGNSTL